VVIARVILRCGEQSLPGVSAQKAAAASAVAAADSERIELEYRCLERCIEQLSEDNRELLLQYYGVAGGAKIEHRKDWRKNTGLAQTPCGSGPFVFAWAYTSAWKNVLISKPHEIYGSVQS
jgi:hypothetical protein